MCLELLDLQVQRTYLNIICVVSARVRRRSFKERIINVFIGLISQSVVVDKCLIARETGRN